MLRTASTPAGTTASTVARKPRLSFTDLASSKIFSPRLCPLSRLLRTASTPAGTTASTVTRAASATATALSTLSRAVCTNATRPVSSKTSTASTARHTRTE